MARTKTTPASLLTLAARNLRRLRTDGAAPWVLWGVVVVAAFGVAAVPRFLNSVSDEALHTAVVEATPSNRNISVEQGMRIRAGDANDAFAIVGQRGMEVRDTFTPAIETIIDAETYVVDSPSYAVAKLPGAEGDPPPRLFRFRHQLDIEEQITVVAGRMPRPAEPVTVRFEEDAPPRVIPRYEVAVTSDTAARLQLDVGGRALLEPDLDDPLQLVAPRRQLEYNLIIEISGIVEPTDPDSEYWFGDQRLHRASSIADSGDPDVIIVSGIGLMSPADYQSLLSHTRSALWNYSWRYSVDPDSFDADDVSAIIGGVQDLELEMGAGGTPSIDEPRLSTGLERISERYLSQRRTTISVLSLAMTALLALGVALVALLGTLTARRRRDTTTLTRSRGASPRQLGWAQLLESLALFVPAALVGLFVSRALVDGREPSFVLWATLAVATVISALGVVLALPLLRGDLGQLLGDESTDEGRGSVRRLVVEGLIVVSALGGLVLFRRRGFDAGGLAATGQGFDPFLAAVPVLLALAFGIVLLRLYPIPIRLAGWYGSKRRDLIGFVGFGRLLRQPLSARLPLPVTLLAVGTAIFGALLVHSIGENRQDSTWHEVGADYRIEPWQADERLGRLVDISGIESIETSVAGVLLNGRVGASLAPSRAIQLLVTEIPEYEAVAAGTRADPDFSKAMLESGSSAAIGTEQNPIPAVVSSTWPGTVAPEPGNVITIQIGPRPVTVVVDEAREIFPGLTIGRPFAVISRSSLAAALPALDLRPNRVYVRAPGDALPAIEATIRGQSTRTRVISRTGLLEELADAPLVAAVDNGYRIAVGLATLLAVLAALAGIALTAKERFRDLGYLRTLGLSSRQVSLLTVVEQAPPALLATFTGVGFGYALVWLVRPGLDLTPFGGDTFPSGIIVDWRLITLVAAGVLAAVIIAIAIYSYRTRRLNLANVLRMGDRG